MNLLTFSTLYPNAAAPTHGIFVETRLRYLLASGEAGSTVVAPVPWFPSGHPRFGRYAAYARAPREEVRHGIRALHPRYAVIPAVGMSVAPFLLAAAAARVLRRLLRDGCRFEIIDAHYFYPDGVAAVLLGRMLGRPVVITARGTDINLIPRYRLPRAMILWAARRASGLVAVCAALKEEMAALGVPSERIEVLRNGVDLERFRPVDRDTERAALGLGGKTLLSVGHLIPRKAHDLAIGSLPHLPEFRLLVAGEGPEEKRLRSLAASLAVDDRVTFLGAVPQERLGRYYGASDALILASSREGWANVLLESMACGTPVVASNVWGTPEVVAAPEAGVLMARRTAEGVAEAVRELFSSYPDRAATRRYAERFDWDDTTAGQLKLFGRVLASRA